MRSIKKLVYLFPQRLVHALIGVSCILLYITAKMAFLFYQNGQVRHIIWIIHITFGYLLIFSLIGRFILFFTGPQYSKISELIKIREWVDYFKYHKIVWKWGHHPLASIGYIGLYICLIYMSYSGIFLVRIIFDYGPISEKYFDQVLLIENFLEMHDLLSLCILIFTILHIGALFWHQQKDQHPIFKSMWNGYQFKKLEGINEKNE